jgi:hypothetical protein
MWKNWGGYVCTKKEKKMASTPARRSKLNLNNPTPQDASEKGRKRESIAEIEEGPTVKRQESESQP